MAVKNKPRELFDTIRLIRDGILLSCNFQYDVSVRSSEMPRRNEWTSNFCGRRSW